MKFVLQRTVFNEHGIFGELKDELGTVVGVTLEHAYQANSTFIPKVASGIYNCIRHAPNRLPYETFLLENVPEFQGQVVSGILIHRGNYNQDSIGCVLLGTSFYPDDQNPTMIKQSAQAFQKFMALLDGIDEFTLVVT